MTALRSLTDDVVENQLARRTTLTAENKAFLRKIIEQYEGFAAITAGASPALVKWIKLSATVILLDEIFGDRSAPLDTLP